MLIIGIQTNACYYILYELLKMVYDLKEKVALITGGASGLGLCYAKELLRNGVKGVTLADIDPTVGVNAIAELEKEFGPTRAIFVQTDVRNSSQFKNAFEKTVEKFKYVDILVNNAGILNDAIWKQEIDININGTINGILLAIEEFFPKYKQGPEAVIVNVASTAATDCYPHIPIYSGTKAAVEAMTRSWGVPHFYDKLGVRFVAIAPGVTLTPLIFNLSGSNLGPMYEEYIALHKNTGEWPAQEPEHVGKEFIEIVKYGHNGSMWSVEGGEPAYEYIPAARLSQKKNLLNKV